MVIMMENKNYDEVIGNPAAPFTNHLASAYGLATQSFALRTGSLPNYFALISGSTQGTNNVFPSQVSFPNTPTIADQLLASGDTVKAYAEDLPADPRVNLGEYDVQHFPWEYFPNSHIPIADASMLAADLNSPAAPDFVWFTPNLIHDQHDGTLQQGDAWLSKFIPAVQATEWYAQNGQIIVEWDESDNETTGVNGTVGGGHIVTLVVSAGLAGHPQQYSGQVDTLGVLRSIEDQYGVPYLGFAADPSHGGIDSLLGVVPPATAPRHGAVTTTSPATREAARQPTDESLVHARQLLVVLLAGPVLAVIGLGIRRHSRRATRRPRGLHVKR